MLAIDADVIKNESSYFSIEFASNNKNDNDEMENMIFGKSIKKVL